MSSLKEKYLKKALNEAAAMTEASKIFDALLRDARDLSSNLNGFGNAFGETISGNILWALNKVDFNDTEVDNRKPLVGLVKTLVACVEFGEVLTKTFDVIAKENKQEFESISEENHSLGETLEYYKTYLFELEHKKKLSSFTGRGRRPEQNIEKLAKEITKAQSDLAYTLISALDKAFKKAGITDTNDNIGVSEILEVPMDDFKEYIRLIDVLETKVDFKTTIKAINGKIENTSLGPNDVAAAEATTPDPKTQGIKQNKTPGDVDTQGFPALNVGNLSPADLTTVATNVAKLWRSVKQPNQFVSYLMAAGLDPNKLNSFMKRKS